MSTAQQYFGLQNNDHLQPVGGTLCMGALGNIWEETSTVQVGDWACSQLISPVARCQRLVEKNR